MAPLRTFSPLLLAGFTAARYCSNFTIPVDISSRQGLFKEVPIESNLEVAAFSQDYTRNGRNLTDELLQEYQTVEGHYEISAKFCRPDSGSEGSVVQLLSHGIGFDKTYWDLSFNDYNYSYVSTALGAGYSTLAIDRFGIGNSSHADPINVVQAQAEVEALNEVTKKLRSGKIHEIGHGFDKIIHVGHSFGSVQSYWLSALYPDNTDGIVLTGWSADASFFPTTVAAWNLHSARLNQPLRFGNSSNDVIQSRFGSYLSSVDVVDTVQSLLETVGVDLSSEDIWNQIATTEVFNLVNGYNHSIVPLDYPSGYLTTSDLTADQYVFLLPGFYDIALGVLAEATKQPVTVGEILTIGTTPSMTSFGGPVLVFTGENDQPFCGGDCFATTSDAASIPAEAADLFPEASAFEAYIQPNTAHGLNAHYNATAGYEAIQSWLAANGLGA